MGDTDFQPLISERLLLRRFRSEDGEPFWRYRTDEEVARYQSWLSSCSREEAEAFVAEQTAQEPNVPGTWFQVAIELRSTGELIGDCGLHTLADDARQFELGITVARHHQRNGYAREALVSVLTYLFGSRGAQRVVAFTDPRNAGCIRLLEGLGMRREAHLIQHLWVKGEWVDDFQYALSVEEWRG